MQPEAFYHIFNRGNNKQSVYFNRENYLYFLRKIRKHLCPYVDVVAYCLMPNHFHLMVYTKPDVDPSNFSNDLKIMLRSYTRAINKQRNRTGSLFQQNTKTKLLDAPGSTHAMTRSHGMSKSETSRNAAFICFHYIHQNPLKAGLVNKMQGWEMSSFQDYAGSRKGTLCSKSLAYQLLEIPESRDVFLEQSNSVMIEGFVS